MKKIVLMCALVGLMPAMAPATDVYLSLSSHAQRSELGVAGFAPATPTVDESKLSREIQEVLRDDLLFSRYFNIIEEGPMYTGKEEELKDWEARGAAMVVSGSLKVSGEDVRLIGRLVDIGSKRVVWEKKYDGNTLSFRQLAHDMNDDIIQRFTGERGIAHTKIVFTNDQTQYKELYVTDYDGHNVRKLTGDSTINILPKWSPDGTEILYTTYLYGNPDLFMYSVTGARRKPVSQSQGLNCAGIFSPDGAHIALTMSRGGNPHLYIINRDGSVVKKLTSGISNNTSPCFAPNGREMVFISDRSGNPQLYIMSLDGGNVRRLTADGFCDSPAWSPRGDRIAFTMRRGNGSTFDIYVYDLGTGQITRLTQDERHNENPTWSPDGRFIVFSTTRSGRKELYLIAADGSGLRRLCEMAGSSATPSWGP
ncbi:MAG: Tol-Pal system beta propeller repeat protein TolB [Elusimicrobia bacterium]|nr:Tol-Pal system beta propeller repeat protein TolB [Elusimicrobiota bacterium]